MESRPLFSSYNNNILELRYRQRNFQNLMFFQQCQPLIEIPNTRTLKDDKKALKIILK
jgi:hypothetical protein